METLNINKLKEIEKLLKWKSPKENFFEKFFPDILDFEDKLVIIPFTNEASIVNFVNKNNWIHMDKNIDIMSVFVIEGNWANSITLINPSGNLSYNI